MPGWITAAQQQHQMPPPTTGRLQRGYSSSNVLAHANAPFSGKVCLLQQADVHLDRIGSLICVGMSVVPSAGLCVQQSMCARVCWRS